MSMRSTEDWTEGYEDGQRSRDDEVDALTRERDAAIREVSETNRALGALQLRYDELRTFAHALVRTTRQALQGEATVSVAEGAADEVEGWLEEHR